MNGVPGTNYITYNDTRRKYIIQKRENQTPIYCGAYPTLINALMKRDEYQAHHWDKEYIIQDQEKIRSKKNRKIYKEGDNPLPQYITYHKKRNHYVIQRNTDKLTYYGSYKTREEAEKALQEYESNNWDYKPTSKIYGPHLPKYITYDKTHNKFIIQQYKNYKLIHYGSYHTLDEAIKEKQAFEEHGWSPEYLEQVKNKRIEEKNNQPDRHIRKIGNKYRIVKTNVYYGTYNTKEEARQYRDKFKSHNWDKTYADTVIRKNKQKQKQTKTDHPHRYIYRSKNSYFIQKDHVYYCTLKTLKEAIRVRNELETHDWDINYALKLRKTKQKKPAQNIEKLGKKQYRITRRGTHYGTYTTLKEAIQIRNQLKTHKWSDEYIAQHPEIEKETPHPHKKINTKPTRYIYPSHGKYSISKNGKHYGTYTTIEEAIQVRDKYESKGWIKPERKRKRPAKYIDKLGENQYKLTRRGTYYGTFKTLEEAIQAREYFESRNWDTTIGYKKHGPHLPKYITYDKKRKYFVIHRYNNYKLECWGSYHTLKEAVEERDLLIKCGWDYETLCDLY